MRSRVFLTLFCLCLIGMFASASCAQLPAPVGHWPLDGNANDISGNDYDGMLNGTTSFVGGQYGDGLDTSAGWVTLPTEAWNDNYGWR